MFQTQYQYMSDWQATETLNAISVESKFAWDRFEALNQLSENKNISSI